jgi:hypothetical protein
MLFTAKRGVLRAVWAAVAASLRNTALYCTAMHFTALFSRARQGMHSSHLCHDLMAISCEAMNLWVQQKQEIY